MAKKRLDMLVVVDLEATCWDTDIPRISEITEFGVCHYDVQAGKTLNKSSIYVKNRRTDISQFCTDLTGITQELLDKEGLPFEGAINRLIQRYGTPSRTWLSWGAYDRVKIEEECREMNAKYPFSVRHINLKNLFAIKHRLHKEVGLIDALEICGMEFVGKQRCGADDAHNTARLIPFVLGSDLSWNHIDRKA